MNSISGVRPPVDTNRPARKRAVVGLALLLLAWPAGVRSEIPSQHLAFFESRVRPLLFEHCLECHGEKSQQGGLRLDSRAGWQKGGVSGPALVPGHPEESLLLKAARQHRSDPQIGPQGKLADAELGTLEEWVMLGAPDPREATAPARKTARVSLEEGRKHWAYQPVKRLEPPAVKNSSWPQGTIDRFVLGLLETNGLSPVADADPYVWLRRVTFDLTGLPPTPPEIASFVTDPSAQGKERVVDRLLASAAFGERWARHWLDLVGYADQLGTVNDVPAPYAWRYRDYVVRAFNTDKPFDRFIREQVAGDLLPAHSAEERQEALTGTGFLLLGEIHIVTSDKLQLRADIVDHQIQKIGTTFLGQTLGCVRCHDHKFDPIALEDYYGLAGIFGSSESAYVTDRGVWSSIVTSNLPENPAQRARRERVLREHSETVTKLTTERAGLTNQLAEAKHELAALEAVRQSTNGASASEPGSLAKGASSPASGAQNAGAESKRGELKARQGELERKIAGLDKRLLHLAYLEPKASVAYCIHDSEKTGDGRITIRGNAHAPGETVPRGFVRVVNSAPWERIPDKESGRVQLADWLAAPENPLPARVTVNRIWQKLFGEGLVRSVDYFGTRGDRPTHPELLDWLASEFVRGGWSQKRLIREIVLSRAYGLSSAHDAAALAQDPDNRLLWRMNRRRLDAEALRDAILCVSNELLPCAGGPALALEFPENIGGLDPKDPNPVSFSTSKFPDAQPCYRTLYLPVVRSRAQPGPAELRNLFDFVAPTEMTGQRPSTSVATQALFLMNSEFMKSHAATLAGWLLKQDAASDRQRLEKLYLRTLNRPVTGVELAQAETFLGAEAAGAGKRQNLWAEYCHALLSSNEFLFRL